MSLERRGPGVESFFGVTILEPKKISQTKRTCFFFFCSVYLGVKASIVLGCFFSSVFEGRVFDGPGSLKTLLASKRKNEDPNGQWALLEIVQAKNVSC